MYTDGASNEHGSGASLILIDSERIEYSYALRLNFANSNNDAEYEALLAGLRIATKMKVEKMHAFVNSREENRKSDALRKLTVVQCEGLTKGVLIEELNERPVDTAEVNAIIEEATSTWMTPIQGYIEHRILPEDAAEARTIQEKARNYTIEEGVLYRNSYLGPLLRCIVHKAMNAGYFWPSMHQDANNEISSCDSCQMTTRKTSKGETPFSQAYGTEAVIPTEIGIPTRRTIRGFDEENEEALKLNLNLLEERREIATIREERRKQQVEKYYNQRVHHKQFKVGKFFLRKNELSKVENTGNLGPKWEGPYEVVKTYGTGAYKLRSMEGAEIPRTWHSSNSRKYYM
ncbi:reverse transcriptase domain-containing protein [Tanacetum coccineum]